MNVKTNRPRQIASTVVTASLLFCAPALKAQSAGDLDLSFGVGGSVITDLGIGYDQCSGLVIQPDQKIVIAGRAYVNEGWYPTLIRMNTDGSLDNSFDLDGIASGDVPHSTSFYAEADALALQPDGKLLYTFHLDFFGQGGLAVTRFNSDGSIDTDFGDNGTAVVVVYEESNYANSLLLLADGKILVTGHGQAYDSAPFNMIAVRFTTDGQLDETFAEAGVFTFQQGTYGSQFFDAKQQDDGKIIVCGSSSYSGYYDYMIVRLNEDGTFDNDFNSDGIFNFNISGSYDHPRFLTLREDDSIIVAGYANSEDGTNMEIAIVSITPGGEFDEDFGTNGIVVTALGEGDDIAQSLVIAPDGKIIVAGIYEDFYIYGAVLRYNANGELDNSFGTSGVTLIDAYSYHLENVKLQADGKIVVCGWTGYSDTNEHHFTASRLLYDGADAVYNPLTPDNLFSIYPNPAVEIIQVKWDEKTNQEPIDVSIIDYHGKVVWKSRALLHNQIQIDTSQFTNGVYSISLQTSQSTTTSTFVVMR